MRISRVQAQENRDKVVEAAARLFRERGVDGVGVGELMKACGFTHGGFYNHFASKDALAAEAIDAAFRQMDAERAKAGSLEELVHGYLSEAARKAPGRTCPAAALGSDAARQPPAVKAVFESGLQRIFDSLEERLAAGEDRRAQAIDLFCRMAGAMILARALPAESLLAREILTSVRDRALADVAARDAATPAD
ncbi:MAG: TetR/AcrR family transcriptional regulator [Phenylobacterium sp.]|uniref:TetR/AcrR family transcriptional regulator n=1 Tax=Phenylobacterium sp. TaxID=1871053 RepID=UPI0039188036